MSKARRPTIEDIIHRAIYAQRIAGEHQTKDAFRATERRLYAYPVILLKIEDDKERIQEISTVGAPTRSKSILRLQRSGQRLSADEIAEALISDIRANIAENEHEIETIKRALDIIARDPYYPVVQYKYFDGKTEDEISLLLNCNPRTIRRAKSRLVGRLAVFLYGTVAI